MISGGDGADSFDGTSQTVALSISGNLGNDILRGSAYDDSIDGGNGDNTLYGNGGDDTISGGTGNDTVYGGSGYDYIYVGDGVNWANGEAGDDVIYGGNGVDTLLGGSGNDYLQSGSGNDFLTGGTGNDSLLGDSGQDSFVFAETGATNMDTIGDFSHTDDTIILKDILDGTVNGQIKGLSFSGGVLTAGCYFEGAGLTGNGASDAAGIYNDTTTGNIYYNPTSSTAEDSVVICTVGSSVAASLDYTDFAYSS